MSESKKVFAKLKKVVLEKGQKALGLLALDAQETVKKGYLKMVPVYDDKGNKLTEIPDSELPSRVANAVSIKISEDNKVIAVHIDGAQENLEALRWYAYSNKSKYIANPFEAAKKRLKLPNVRGQILSELNKK